MCPWHTASHSRAVPAPTLRLAASALSRNSSATSQTFWPAFHLLSALAVCKVTGKVSTPHVHNQTSKVFNSTLTPNPLASPVLASSQEEACSSSDVCVLERSGFMYGCHGCIKRYLHKKKQAHVVFLQDGELNFQCLSYELGPDRRFLSQQMKLGRWTDSWYKLIFKTQVLNSCLSDVWK